jgi:hypothetical protein
MCVHVRGRDLRAFSITCNAERERESAHERERERGGGERELGFIHSQRSGLFI